MSRHLKKNRPVSGVLFYKPPDGVYPSSDTRRHVKTPKYRAPRGNPSDENSAPNLNTYAMFAEALDEIQPTPPPTSLGSLSIPKSNAQEPSPELEPPERLCLPVVDVRVDVTVDGTVATTELKQSFHNPSNLVIPDAQHTFPLYDGAIVTSFKCKIGESRVLRGIVKPKEEARQTFEKAKKQKIEAAALFQELTPEIFQTSLGNIPASTTVDVTLRYIHELKVVQVPQGTGLAVTVPTSIAPRYSTSTGLRMSPRLNENSLEIVLRVFDNGHIITHDCHTESGHDFSFEGTGHFPQRTISNPAELMGLQDQSQLVFKHASKTAVLKRDFNFVIQMYDTYRLSSRAVLSPADDDGHAALMVSLRPSELFSNAVRSNSFAGEILFVLDRSGSMGWTVEGSNELKINAMRDAMRLALSGVQDTCAFNVISFGSEVHGMWAESRVCSTDAEMKQARDYVSHLRADMGGTEILEAIRAAVKTRVQSRVSTQVIILTDGEVQDDENEPILELVWRTRKELGDKVRFFILGIGDSVSHRLVETIAELGGGYCDIINVLKRPRWEDRLNRMLRSAMGPDSWTCNVELGTEFQRQTLMEVNVRAEAESTPSSTSCYIQAPSPIPPLHPYAYQSVFFILDVKDHRAPDKVTVHTTTPGAKKKAQDVNVELSTSRTIHHLAAKAVLQDMEDDIKRGIAEEEPARHNAEALGIKYSVTSRWTSFVAVADDEAEKKAHEIDIYQSMLKEMTIEDVLRLDTSDDESHYGSANFDAIFPSFSSNHDVGFAASSDAGFFASWKGGFAAHSYSDFPEEIHDVERQSELNRLDAERKATGSEFRRRLKQMRPSFKIDRSKESANEKVISEDAEQSEKSASSRSSSSSVRPSEPVYAPSPARSVSSDPGPRTDVASHLIRRQRSGSCGAESPSGTPYYGVDMDSDADFDDYDEASDADEPEPYQPSVEGPLMWKDAVGSQCGGLFVLPDVIRAKLRQHFCNGAAKWLREELARFPTFSTLPNAKTVELIDTLMMIVYFSTHLATEEDFWYLIMDKAEDAVLLALGLDGNEQDGLESEPFSAMKLSIEHTHFKKAQIDARVEQKDQNQVPADGVAETCQVCRETFGIVGGTKGTASGFVCLSDECYDADGRRVWETWEAFWKHQIVCGHMLCSTGSLIDEED